MIVELLAENDIATAQGILDAAGCTAPTGDLVNGVYDAQGAFYQLPEWVVCDPVQFVDIDKGKVIDKGEDIERDGEEEEYDEDEEEEENKRARRREEKGKGVLRGEVMKVKARLSDRGGKDLMVNMGREESVRVLIGRIKEEAGVSITVIIWLTCENAGSGNMLMMGVDLFIWESSYCIYGQSAQRRRIPRLPRIQRRACC